MAGEEGREVLGDADRAHARAAAAVGDAEGLVQVEVADVGADVAGAAEADLRVHVGAVHVDLAAVLVDDLADFLDGFLEDAVGGGVGDHQRGEVLARARRPWRLRSARSMLPLVVAGDGDDLEAGDDGAGGVGAVGGVGDQADVAVRLGRGSRGRRG